MYSYLRFLVLYYPCCKLIITLLHQRKRKCSKNVHKKRKYLSFHSFSLNIQSYCNSIHQRVIVETRSKLKCIVNCQNRDACSRIYWMHPKISWSSKPNFLFQVSLLTQAIALLPFSCGLCHLQHSIQHCTANFAALIS